jgi:hypothetical protein
MGRVFRRYRQETSENSKKFLRDIIATANDELAEANDALATAFFCVIRQSISFQN